MAVRAEADLVDPSVVQQAERYAKARRLLEAAEGETSLWAQLPDEARRLEDGSTVLVKNALIATFRCETTKLFTYSS